MYRLPNGGSGNALQKQFQGSLSMRLRLYSGLQSRKMISAWTGRALWTFWRKISC